MKLPIILAVTIFLFLLVITPVDAREETLFLGDYELTYEFDEDDVEASEKFTLRITILNSDSQTKENIELELEDTFPFEIESDDTWEIDALEADASRSRSFRIDVDDRALDDEYELEFRLEDSDDDYEDELDIDVNSILADLVVSDIVSTPSTISPDLKDIKLVITLDNVGGGDAISARSELILPEGFQAADSFSFIESLETISSGAQKDAEFFIDTLPGLSGGVYNAQLRIDYEDQDDNPRFQVIDFDIIVRDRPMFVVEPARTVPRVVTSGSEGNTLELAIVNVGREDGEETSIRVFETNDLPLSFDEKTQRIGELLPGERGSAIFTFEVDNDAASNSYLLKIQTRTITEGNVITDEFTVPVSIAEREPRNLLVIGFLFFPLILLIVLLIMIVNLRGRKKKSSDRG